MKLKRVIPLCLIMLLTLVSLGPASVMAGPEQPYLQVSTVSFSPETVAPGKDFVMSVTLTNHGEYNAYNISLDVVSVAGSQDLGIFSMVGNGNHFFVEEIDAGQSHTINISMVSDPSAEAKNYNLNLSMSYESWGETQYQSTGTVGVFLNEVDSMSIISQDRFVINGDSDENSQVSFEIANFGANPVKGVQLSIISEKVTFENGYEYYGTFEKDDYDDFNTRVSYEEVGEYPAKIILKYMDSFNNERVIEKDVAIIIPDDAAVADDSGNGDNAFIRFLKAIFGIGS